MRLLSLTSVLFHSHSVAPPVTQPGPLHMIVLYQPSHPHDRNCEFGRLERVENWLQDDVTLIL